MNVHGTHDFIPGRLGHQEHDLGLHAIKRLTSQGFLRYVPTGDSRSGSVGHLMLQL
jgi:hypothetical protein